MKNIIAMSLIAGAALAAAAPAEARQGCGGGYHRGPAGHCRPNMQPRYGRQTLIVGNFYRGQGYWDGHRYWQNRDRDRRNGHWRYR